MVTPRNYAKLTNPSTLMRELLAVGIVAYPDAGFKTFGVSVDSGAPRTTVYVIDALPAADATTIDNAVAAHVATPDSSPQVKTTNAVPTTMFTIPVPVGKGLRVVCEVIFREQGLFAGGIQRRTAIFINNAGVVSQVGATQTELSITSLAITGLGFLISGQNVLVQVTGLAGRTFLWKATEIRPDVSL